MSRILYEHLCNVEGLATIGRYHGGNKYGQCFQLTISNHDCYVQFTTEDAKKFFKRCLKEIKKIEKENTKTPPKPDFRDIISEAMKQKPTKEEVEYAEKIHREFGRLTEKDLQRRFTI